MKKMIDELWDGEISPQDTLISDNQEYRELQHRQSQNKAELLEALSDEQKELLEKFCATEIELNGISEREAFTAGFKIAMRDLEIRGAGNLLGPQQHGHITGIGFAAYCEMLEKTIERLKNGKEAEPEPEPVLEIQAEAYIPDSYIPDPRYKMELYRRFSELEYSQREDFLDEIIDRFGNPPPEVEMLWRLAALKGLCRVLKIRGVNVHQGIIRLTFGEKAQVNPEAVLKLLMQHPKTMTLKNGQEQQLTYRMGTSKQEPLAWLEQTLPALILED